MEAVFQIIAIASIFVGTAFSFVGVLGYIRLPDVFTRLHAVGKVNVFGVVFLLIAAAAVTPLSWGHSVVLIFFLLVTGPVNAHAIASAAYRIGLTMKGSHGDELAEAVRKMEK